MCREGYLLFLVGVCRRGLREEEEEEEGGCGLGAAPGTAEPAPLLPEPQRSSGGNGVKKPHQKVNPSCEAELTWKGSRLSWGREGAAAW